MVYSVAGMGKTVLCSTAPSPLIISAEAGLLSLADVDIPAVEVSTVEGVYDVLKFCKSSKEAAQFQTICLDSISEIAEVLLKEYMDQERDGRAAYGRLNSDMAQLIRSFRDIKGKNVYFTAKELMLTDDESGVTTLKASMPGKSLLNGLPFFFDEVFAMRMGKLEDGTKYRYLQTAKDFRYVDCKDISGKLSPVEKPDLSYIFDKIAGVKNKPEAEEQVEDELKEKAELEELHAKDQLNNEEGDE